jgi:DNA-binding XRE family transcriptional regulator
MVKDTLSMLVDIRRLKYFSANGKEHLKQQRKIHVVMNMTTRLKLLITEAGLKQSVIAQKVGMSPTAFNMVVNGKSYPNVKTALKIAKALGVSVEYLWGDEEGK